MRYLSIRLFSLFYALLLISVGCTPNPQGRLPLSGTVSVNGVPLKSGTVTFGPFDTVEVKTFSGAVIDNGKFSVPFQKGVVPGEYLVVFNAEEDTGKIDPTAEGSSGRIMRQLIPPKYNEKSKLKITVAKGKTRFDFALDVKDEDFK